MTLGELIELLEGVDAETPVRFSDGTVPQQFYSWRGVYAELTLEPADAAACPTCSRPRDGVRMTAGDLHAAAVAANGGTFEGYKGGDFVMDLSTPVWADEYGACAYNAIVGHTITDEGLVLNRVNIGDYR